MKWIASLAAAALLGGCAARQEKPVEPPAKKARGGFFERAWTTTKKTGTWAWVKTRDGAGSGWESAKDLATAPFSKKKTKPAAPAKSLAMSIEIEPAAVRLPATKAVAVTLRAKNESAQMVTLDFPTTQHIELLLKTELGAIVQRWSDDQRVSREPGYVTVNPGERIEYTATLSTRNMAPGKTYIIEASILGHGHIRATKTVVPQ